MVVSRWNQTIRNWSSPCDIDQHNELKYADMYPPNTAECGFLIQTAQQLGFAHAWFSEYSVFFMQWFTLIRIKYVFAARLSLVLSELSPHVLGIVAHDVPNGLIQLDKFLTFIVGPPRPKVFVRVWFLVCMHAHTSSFITKSVVCHSFSL